MKKILIPIDGSEFSERALEKAKEIATLCGSDIVLLNVKDRQVPFDVGTIMESGTTIQHLIDSSASKAEEIISGANEALKGFGGQIENVILEGKPSDAIISYLKKNKVDLVIMGSHGISGGVQSVMLGSVANKVLHHVDVPIMIVK
jgi:nucleotide-binding universal stress UspA family protein